MLPKQAGNARDGFIDALRAIALIRVTVWHALGIPLLSWTITTMPLMFFVAGSLLYASLDGKNSIVVLKRRLKRFLIPFWGFGAIVVSTMALVDLRSTNEATDFSLSQIAAWLVPLTNPTGSAWEAGWASSPLWYMRAYLWILILAPALMRCWRRFPHIMLGLCAITAVVVQIIANLTMPGPNGLLWIVGDLGTYGFFTLAGFAHREGRFAGIEPRALIEWLCVAVLLTVVAWRLFPSEDGVVNHSYPALLTFGMAWLCAALLARPILRRVPTVPIAGPILHWMTRRAMSIYLWHSPCIVAAYWLLNALDVAARPIAVLALTAILVVLAATATGWLEDLAGNRPAEIIPLPENRAVVIRRLTPASKHKELPALVSGAAIGVTIALVAGAGLATAGPASAERPSAAETSFETGTGLALPPAPSGRPDPGPIASATAQVAPAQEAVTSSLQAEIDLWRVEHDVDGVSVGIVSASGRQLVASGQAPTGPVPITSVTKTMTAAIVMQLVEEGSLTLDGPLPLISGITDRPSLRDVTVRHLLNHSSGLVPYQEAVGYTSTGSLTAAEAIEMATASPRQWEPGTNGGYSNSGFLLLGALIEHVAGADYQSELRRRVIDPFDLTATSLDTSPRLGWTGGAAGGALSSIEDLLTWGDVLFRSQRVLTQTSHQQMMSVDASLSSGLGTFPICPCTTAQNQLLPEWIGHNGGSVMVQYNPESDVVLAVSLTESFWTEDLDQQHVYELLRRVHSHL